MSLRKTCPFCGKPGTISETQAWEITRGYSGWVTYHYVKCSDGNCGARSGKVRVLPFPLYVATVKNKSKHDKAYELHKMMQIRKAVSLWNVRKGEYSADG